MFHKVKRFQFSEFTVGQLVASGVHLGHRSIATDPRIFEMLAGDRDGVSILSLGKSIVGLKPGLSVLAKIGAKRGKALFPNVDPRIFGSIPAYVKNFCLRYFLVGRKVPGLLTNFMVVRRNFPDLQKTKIVPSFTFGFTANDHHILWESNRLNIPSIGIFDSNTNPMGHAFYAVPGNDDSFNALHLYYQLAFWALGDGLNRYLFKWGATRKFKLKKILNQFHSLVLLRPNSISNRILENYTNLNKHFTSNSTLNKKRSARILNTLTRIFYVNVFAYLVNQTYYAYNLGKNAYSSYPYLNINPEFYSFKGFNLPFPAPTQLYLRHKQFFTFLPSYNYNIFDQMPPDIYNSRFKLLGFAKAKSMLLRIIKHRLRSLVLKNKINKVQRGEENTFLTKSVAYDAISKEAPLVSDLIDVQKYNYKMLQKESKLSNQKLTVVSYYSKNKNLYKLPVFKKSFSSPIKTIYGKWNVKKNKFLSKNLITKLNGFDRNYIHKGFSSSGLNQTTFMQKFGQVVFQRREFHATNKFIEFSYPRPQNKNKSYNNSNNDFNFRAPKSIADQSTFSVGTQSGGNKQSTKAGKNTSSIDSTNSQFNFNKKESSGSEISNFKFYPSDARKQNYYNRSQKPISINLNQANRPLNKKFNQSGASNSDSIAHVNNTTDKPFFGKFDRYNNSKSKHYHPDQRYNAPHWIQNKVKTHDQSPINHKISPKFFKVDESQKTVSNPQFPNNNYYYHRPRSENYRNASVKHKNYDFAKQIEEKVLFDGSKNQGNFYQQSKISQSHFQPKSKYWQRYDNSNRSNKQFEYNNNNRKPPHHNYRYNSPREKTNFTENQQFSNKFNQKNAYYKKNFKSNNYQQYQGSKKAPYQKDKQFFDKKFKSDYNKHNYKGKKFNQIIKFVPPSEAHLTEFQRTRKRLRALNSLSIKLRRLKFTQVRRLLPVKPRGGANAFVIRYIELLKKIYRKFNMIPYSFRFKRVKLRVRKRKIRRRTPKTIVKIVLKQQARKIFRKFKKRYPTLKFSFIWLSMQKLFKKRVVKRFLRKKVFRYNLTHNPVFGHYKTSQLRHFIRRMPKFRSSIIRKNLYKLPIRSKNYFYWLNSYLNFYVRDVYSVLNKVKLGIRAFKESEIFSRHFSFRNKRFFSAHLQLPFQNQRRLLSYFDFKVRDMNELIPKRKKRRVDKINLMNKLYRVFRARRLKRLRNFRTKGFSVPFSIVAKRASQPMFNTVGYQTFDYAVLLRAIRNRRLGKREFFHLRRKEYMERVDRKYFNAKGLFQDWQKKKWKESFEKWKLKQRKFLMCNRRSIVSAALRMGMKVPKVILDSRSIIFKKLLPRKILKVATNPNLRNVIMVKNTKPIRIPKLKLRRYY